MRKELLREIANDYLVPLFSGAELDEGYERVGSQAESIAFLSSTEIAFRVSYSDHYRLILKRSQPWAPRNTKPVPEFNVVRAFVRAVRAMEEELDGPLRHDLLSTFQRRIVANSVAVGSAREAVLAGIDLLAAWAARLYEGAPIAASLGFRNSPQDEQTFGLRELAAHDFSAVMSNGHDTILEFDFEGRLVGHGALAADDPIPPFCPYRQAPIAAWTTQHEQRVAVTLNRLGEILVLRDKQLLFVRRGGRWHFITHKPVIMQMDVPRSVKLRTAIYETCLDASFARTGACLAVVSSTSGRKWQSRVAPDDWLTEPTSERALAISQIVSGKTFNQLDRRLRQELSAIDGAIVLAHTGELLAAGAIVSVGAGSSGGGRAAAARALSQFGVGIKISQDGGITGYRANRTEPSFLIM